jgi:hypothetical protein
MIVLLSYDWMQREIFCGEYSGSGLSAASFLNNLFQICIYISGTSKTVVTLSNWQFIVCNATVSERKLYRTWLPSFLHVMQFFRQVRATAPQALIYVDAVHYAPHMAIDVQDLDCDFCVCSTFKFFGPHCGMLFGKSNLMRTLRYF